MRSMPETCFLIVSKLDPCRLLGVVFPDEESALREIAALESPEDWEPIEVELEEPDDEA